MVPMLVKVSKVERAIKVPKDSQVLRVGLENLLGKVLLVLKELLELLVVLVVKVDKV